MKNNPLYTVNDIHFSYLDQRVLHIDFLEIYSKKITVLRGPNGSGKTTLLKLLNKLLEPDTGRITLNGLSLSEDTIRKKSIYLHQEPYLFRGTVENNLKIVLRIKGITRDRWNRIISEKLELMGLENFQKRRCHELSGGEKKRVALARALISEPEILLLDEPDTNIDQNSSTLLGNVLVQLKEMGISIVMSTHNSDFAYRYGDDFIDIESGLTKSFEENIFKGEYNHEIGHYGIFNSGKLTLAVPGLKGEFKTAILSPDDVILSEKKIETSAQNQLEGIVSSYSKMESFYSVTISAPDPVISHITEESFVNLKIKKGNRLIIIFKASAVKLC